MGINDVIDLQEIKTKVEALLLENKTYEIDIFFSPGTSIMQLSWFICHQSLGLNTRLLQTREGKFTGKKEPDLIELKIEKSSVPMSVTISQQNQTQASASTDYLISPGIASVYKKADLIAQTDNVRCLIRGASGTGKEHLARCIHENSARAAKPYLAVNCSALSDSLLESRLFGYVKGAFTDAKDDKKGILEEANGGTVFLDEIGDISPYMQQALLRVLQSGEIMPVGGNKPKKIDVRIVSATHKPLEEMCEEGTFRWDLYYRLAVVELALPTLQERGAEEKKALIEFFLKRIKKELNKKQLLKFSKDAYAQLLAYPFAGNIRELENVIMGLYVFCENEVQINDLPQRFFQSGSKQRLSFNWQENEKDLISRALTFYKGNQNKTLKALGYGSINTLKSKMREYGIE
ncbi:sigma-54-dependent Fis family transcriptional regulator [Emticicia sp. TH156]|nr:sigma-54-dependent Fis family transcriptional regulator [Emticicia sp. TH156]